MMVIFLCLVQPIPLITQRQGRRSRNHLQQNQADKEEEKAVVPTSPSPPSDEYLRQEERNDLERRVMRYCLFAVMMFFAVFFLCCGLFFALKVGDGCGSCAPGAE
ncbi:hypothetical protein JJP90_22740 [Enterobacter cloacae]|nr:hypothetical protein [Enterobacter cloacae]